MQNGYRRSNPGSGGERKLRSRPQQRPMPHYRLYPLDERGHVCDPPQIIEAKTDADAIAQAMQLANGHDLEVWDMARRVGLIERRSD